MKNIIKILQRMKPGLLPAVAAVIFVLSGSQARADDWGGHQRYYDRDGFYDGQHRYHQFERYHDHRGYWDQHNGTRIFINFG